MKKLKSTTEDTVVKSGIFPEAKIYDEDGNEVPYEEPPTLTPAKYFETVKNKLTTETADNIKLLYQTTIDQLKKYIVTGQKAASKNLYARCVYLEKEFRLLEKGVSKYVLRTDIENYIDKIADKCVVVIELQRYERTIPDELINIVANTKDIFDAFYIVFTDYTGESRSKVQQERREKDPILFGNIFIDGTVSDKMYFIGDWEDEYCDLTLDKMIEEIAKKEPNKEIVNDIVNGAELEEIKNLLFGEKLGVN